MTSYNFSTQKINHSFLFNQMNQIEDREQLTSQNDLEKLLDDRENQDNANRLLQFVKKADKENISLLLSIPKFTQYLLKSDAPTPVFKTKQEIAQILIQHYSELILNPEDMEHSLIQYTLEHGFHPKWFLNLFSKNEFSNATIHSLITIFTPAMVTSGKPMHVFNMVLTHFIVENMQSMPLDLLEGCFKTELDQKTPAKLLLTELLHNYSSNIHSLELEKKDLIKKFMTNTTVVAIFVFKIIKAEEKIKIALEELQSDLDQLPLFFKHYLSQYHPIRKKPLKDLTESELTIFIQDYAFVYTQYKCIPIYAMWKEEMANLHKPLAKVILQIIFPTIDSFSLDCCTDFLAYDIQLQGVDGLLPCITGQISFIEYMTQRSEWTNRLSIGLVKLAITFQSPITAKALEWAIVMHNKTMLEMLCKDGKLPTLNVYEQRSIMERLASSQNRDLLQLCVDHHIVNVQNAPLENMIKKGQTLALRFFLENGYRFPNKEYAQLLLNLSVQSYNVESICLIYEKFHIQFPHRVMIFPLLFPIDTEEHTKDKLLRFALASPLSTLNEVIDCYTHIPLKQWLEEMGDILALQARIPDSCHSDLSKIKKFVQINKTYLDILVPKLPHLSWREFLEECLELRKKNPEDHLSKEHVFRIREEQNLHTNFITVFEEFSYAQAWHQAYVLTANLPYDPSLLVKNGDHITFFYRLPNNELVKTNRLYTESTSFPRKLYWRHAEWDVIEKCQFHLNTLHRQVVEFPSPKDNLQKFEQLVAECYWLMSTLAETVRGAAHNTKLWLLAIYRHHSLPPPIPKLKYFYIDTMMMCMTVDQAIVLWAQLFEEH